MYPRQTLHKTDWRLTCLLMLAIAGVYVPAMGSYGMFDPWETHYTEVARQFMENDDWMSTVWHNGTGPEGWAENHFWSKPVGSFWLSGLSLKLLGYQRHITLRGKGKSPLASGQEAPLNWSRGSDPGEYLTGSSVEWAVRLPFFLCGLFGMVCVFLMVMRLFSQRAAIFSALVMALSPMYFMITRQAMTDMPYVGLMSGGVALLALAIFGEREPIEHKSYRVLGRELQLPRHWGFWCFVGAFVALMSLQLWAIIASLRRIPLALSLGPYVLSAALPMILYVVLGLVTLWVLRRTKTVNEIYLYTFYMVVGVAGLSKGLIGALQPGFIVLLYLLVSREWRLLTEISLGRGLLIAGSVFAPWYHGMYLRFGARFWNELFGTEQLRRLTIGEQAQAKGTWEYYVRQLGYAMFPWIAFLPSALARLFSTESKERTARFRCLLFVGVWFAATMLLFGMTMTKYHHYILPAIPPAAILIGLFLDELCSDRMRRKTMSVCVSLVLLILVATDLVNQPAHWIWMYTYLYTDNWANGVPEGPHVWVYAVACGVIIAGMLFAKWQRHAVVALFVLGILGGGYVLNWYQIGCAPHWSQKYVLQSYYRLRRSAKEQLIAWQFNWRGETWYTAAQVVVAKSLDNTAIQGWLKKRPGRRFFFITERSRYGSLRSMLPTPKAKKTLRIVDDSNLHHILAEATL